jgi:hypothetical protein
VADPANPHRDVFAGFPRVRASSGLWKLDFGGSTPNLFDSVSVVGTISSAVPCANLTQVVLKNEYSASNVTAKFRVILLDKNSTVGRAWSWQEFSLNTGDQTNVMETGYYHGEMITFQVSGADKFQIYIAAITNSGSVSTWYSVV